MCYTRTRATPPPQQTANPPSRCVKAQTPIFASVHLVAEKPRLIVLNMSCIWVVCQLHLLYTSFANLTSLVWLDSSNALPVCYPLDHSGWKLTGFFWGMMPCEQRVPGKGDLSIVLLQTDGMHRRSSHLAPPPAYLAPQCAWISGLIFRGWPTHFLSKKLRWFHWLVVIHDHHGDG